MVGILGSRTASSILLQQPAYVLLTFTPFVSPCLMSFYLSVSFNILSLLLCFFRYLLSFLSVSLPRSDLSVFFSFFPLCLSISFNISPVLVSLWFSMSSVLVLWCSPIVPLCLFLSLLSLSFCVSIYLFLYLFASILISYICLSESIHISCLIFFCLSTHPTLICCLSVFLLISIIVSPCLPTNIAFFSSLWLCTFF
jgi:hypothetical protein